MNINEPNSLTFPPPRSWIAWSPSTWGRSTGFSKWVRAQLAKAMKAMKQQGNTINKQSTTYIYIYIPSTYILTICPTLAHYAGLSMSAIHRARAARQAEFKNRIVHDASQRDRKGIDPGACVARISTDACLHLKTPWVRKNINSITDKPV